MRLAFITYEYPPDSAFGGIATYVQQAARMMRDRGWDVEVFASSAMRSDTVQQDGIRVTWVREQRRSRFADAAAVPFLKRHRDLPFDVIEGPEYHADARAVKRLAPELPLVVKMHTPSALIRELNETAPPTMMKLARRVIRHMAGCVVRWRPPQFDWLFGDTAAAHANLDRLERAHARSADIVAPPCVDLCKYATSRWGIDERNIRLSPHPYEPHPSLVALTPRRDGMTVAYVGRLEKRKGIEVLARAIPEVCRRFPNVRFRFIGAVGLHAQSGLRYDDWVRKECGEHAGHLEFVGKIPLTQMSMAYGDVDVCVFPSLWENFPNVCLEAMAAGRAVIGSSSGGMREMLDEGKTGMLVEAGDRAALSAAILTLLTAPAERLRLGAEGRDKVLRSYNSIKIGAMMDAIYREAIDKSSQRWHAPLRQSW